MGTMTTILETRGDPVFCAFYVKYYKIKNVFTILYYNDLSVFSFSYAQCLTCLTCKWGVKRDFWRSRGSPGRRTQGFKLSVYGPPPISVYPRGYVEGKKNCT